MNNINKNYVIITDVKLDDPLCEYFNVNNIIFNFISKDLQTPMIDQIVYQTHNKKILLIVGINSFLRLCDETSQYNSFLNLILRDKIKLIYYEPGDSIFEINNKGPFSHIENYCKSKSIAVVEKINDIIKDLKFVWWGDAVFGEYITKQLKNVEFYHLHNHILNKFKINHFFNLKKNIEKKNTFFSLSRLYRGEKRIHRKIILEKIQSSKYAKNAIVHFNLPEKEKNIFSDLEAEYGKIYLKNVNWPDSLPVVSYYEKTYFEVICETLGAIDGDDTFYLTEKTLKPIVMRHPFIVLSTKHFLKNLRGLGFKTFGDFIDESYDECDRIKDRVEIIFKNLERLDMDASKKFYEDSLAIRKHNQSHLMYLQGRNNFDIWNKWNIFFEKLC